MQVKELLHHLGADWSKDLDVVVRCEHDSYTGHEVTGVSVSDGGQVVIGTRASKWVSLSREPYQEDATGDYGPGSMDYIGKDES